MSAEPSDRPDLEAVIESDDPELADAYNDAVEAEMAERVEALEDAEQNAVAALRDDAQDSIETETVKLPSGLELEVRTRFTQRAERLQEDLAELEQEGASVADIRRLNAQLLAEMCETDGYDSPEPWDIAARDDDAGMVWMGEVTDVMLEPIHEKAKELQGNRRASGGSRNPTGGKQSGGWQKR